MQLLKSIKYKGNFHKAGEIIKVDDKDIEEFIVRGVLKPVRGDRKYQTTNNIGKELKPVKTHLNASNDKLSIPEIKLLLDNKGIEYKSNMKKNELLKLLEEG